MVYADILRHRLGIIRDALNDLEHRLQTAEYDPAVSLDDFIQLAQRTLELRLLSKRYRLILEEQHDASSSRTRPVSHHSV